MLKDEREIVSIVQLTLFSAPTCALCSRGVVSQKQEKGFCLLAKEKQKAGPDGDHSRGSSECTNTWLQSGVWV